MRHLLNDPFRNDWFSLDYLSHGTDRQRQARRCLQRLGVQKLLAPYRPVLTGTIPLGCYLPESDLDILCQSEDAGRFLQHASELFSRQRAFTTSRKALRGGPGAIVRFIHEGFKVEVVCQQRAVDDQYAFAHMLAEAMLLFQRGTINRHAIRRLKQQGMTTEEAFARHFSLPHDPYEHLYKMYLYEKKQLKIK